MGINVLNRESYWAEAVNCANYLSNRLHTSSGKEAGTPFQFIHRKQPDLANLRKRLKVFVHVPKAKCKDKFTFRAEEVILFAYYRGNGYKIFYPFSEKVLISYDVDLFHWVWIVGDYRRQWHVDSNRHARFRIFLRFFPIRLKKPLGTCRLAPWRIINQSCQQITSTFRLMQLDARQGMKGLISFFSTFY